MYNYKHCCLWYNTLLSWTVPEFEVPTYIPSIGLLELLLLFCPSSCCFNLLSINSIWKKISWVLRLIPGEYKLCVIPLLLEEFHETHLAHAELSWLSDWLPPAEEICLPTPGWAVLPCGLCWSQRESSRNLPKEIWQILRVDGYIEFKHFVKKEKKNSLSEPQNLFRYKEESEGKKVHGNQAQWFSFIH